MNLSFTLRSLCVELRVRRVRPPRCARCGSDGLLLRIDGIWLCRHHAREHELQDRQNASGPFTSTGPGGRS